MSEGNRRYQVGRRAEYLVKKIFEDAGFSVSRSASSKGIWDLTALKVGRERETEVYICVLTQVKTRRRTT